jgi:hypothetical protein
VIVHDDEYLDFSKVPESKGIPPMLHRIAAIGIVCIFIIGGAVVMLAGYGHEWPAQNTLRMDLGSMPK